MQIAQSHKPFNKVDYYPLQNGAVDVYLHKNDTQEIDEDGNTIHKTEEVYFQVKDSITKSTIEDDFDSYWENEGERIVNELTTTERIEMLEDTINFLLGL